MDFQEACNSKGHSPDAVESLITRTVIGLYGEIKLELIDKAKRLYTSFSSGDWREQAHRAVFYLFYTSGQQAELGVNMKETVTVRMDAELKKDYLADHA